MPADSPPGPRTKWALRLAMVAFLTTGIQTLFGFLLSVGALGFGVVMYRLLPPQPLRHRIVAGIAIVISALGVLISLA